MRRFVMAKGVDAMLGWATSRAALVLSVAVPFVMTNACGPGAPSLDALDWLTEDCVGEGGIDYFSSECWVRNGDVLEGDARATGMIGAYDVVLRIERSGSTLRYSVHSRRPGSGFGSPQLGLSIEGPADAIGRVTDIRDGSMTVVFDDYELHYRRRGRGFEVRRVSRPRTAGGEHP